MANPRVIAEPEAIPHRIAPVRRIDRMMIRVIVVRAPLDLGLGQGLLQPFHCGLVEALLGQNQALEIPQPGEVLQSRSGQQGAAEVKLPQGCQVFQAGQVIVEDSRRPPRSRSSSFRRGPRRPVPRRKLGCGQVGAVSVRSAVAGALGPRR